MICKNCLHEIADDVQSCPDCGAELTSSSEKEIEATPSADAVINTSGARKLPFIFTFVGVCLIALGYLAFWVANLALGGEGVANSAMITSVLGRVATCLVHSVILAAAIVAIIYAVKIFLNKGNLAFSIYRFNFLPRVLTIFSVFAMLDGFVIFFVATISNSIVGEKLTWLNNYYAIAEITENIGYAGLGIREEIELLSDGFLAVASAVLFGLSFLAFSAVSFFLFGKIKNYYMILANTANGAQYDKDNKPPIILSFVMAALYVGLAVISLIAGVWVDAIIQIGMSIFLGACGWMFISVHTDLRKTSVE